MEKALKFFFVAIVIVGTMLAIIYFGFIHLMGNNFVHDKPASPEYYDHVANRIYFTTKYRGDKFDILLDSFLKNNPQYLWADPSNSFVENTDCSCSCVSLTKIIYFNSSPREAYEITYDSDTMYAGGAGIIDNIFLSKNDKWLCIKSSKFDSIEKIRIENRLDTAIIEKLK